MMFFVTHPDLFITNTIQNSSRTSCQFEQKLLGVENTINTNHNAISKQRLDQELSRIWRLSNHEDYMKYLCINSKTQSCAIYTTFTF